MHEENIARRCCWRGMGRGGYPLGRGSGVLVRAVNAVDGTLLYTEL